MNEITNKINELKNEKYRIEAEIRELERQNSNYYIGVSYESDGKYGYDKYYYRLGFISEEEANTWVREQLLEDDDWCKTIPTYFEVSEEIYKKYNDWATLDKLYMTIDRNDDAIRKLDGLDGFKKTVSDAIENVAREIGIGSLSENYPVY